MAAKHIEVNPYAPSVVFHDPRTKQKIVGIVHSVEPETGKIKVAYAHTLYTIRPHMVELIQY